MFYYGDAEMVRYFQVDIWRFFDAPEGTKVDFDFKIVTIICNRSLDHLLLFN